MSWLCVFLLVFTSPRSARVQAGFLHKDLLTKRALFDGASPTSLVIRPKRADKWVSTAVAAAGAFTPGMVRSLGLPAVRVLAAFADRYNHSFQFWRVFRKSNFAVGTLPVRIRLENLEAGATFQDGSPCRLARLVAVSRNSTDCRRSDERGHVFTVACVGLHWLFGQEFLEAHRFDRQSKRVQVSVFFDVFMISRGLEASSLIQSYHWPFLHPLFFPRARKSFALEFFYLNNS